MKGQVRCQISRTALDCHRYQNPNCWSMISWGNHGDIWGPLAATGSRWYNPICQPAMTMITQLLGNSSWAEFNYRPQATRTVIEFSNGPDVFRASFWVLKPGNLTQTNGSAPPTIRSWKSPAAPCCALSFRISSSFLSGQQRRSNSRSSVMVLRAFSMSLEPATRTRTSPAWVWCYPGHGATLLKPWWPCGNDYPQQNRRPALISQPISLRLQS